VTPEEEAEYQRRLAAREARRREIDEAVGVAPTQPARKRKRKGRRYEDWSTREVYGNTVIRPWRRSIAGGWTRR
jgi:hypothetical protein